jgi:hypothetical protein
VELIECRNFMRLSLKKGAQAILSNGSVQEIRGISLVFCEMWDTTALYLRLFHCTGNEYQGSWYPTSRKKRARYGAPMDLL